LCLQRAIAAKLYSKNLITPQETKTGNPTFSMPNTEVPTPDALAPRCLSAEEQSVNSAIEELQDAFGALLVFEKEKVKVENFRSWKPWHDIFGAKQKARNAELLFKPHWTGAFEIFSFPQELRDDIYFYYLYRPEGQALTWRRRINNGVVSADWRGYNAVYSPTAHDETLNLFLVSRRVYEEAFSVFCRFCPILVDRHQPKSLYGALRLFPETAAKWLQRVEVRYDDDRAMSPDRWNTSGSSTTWAKIAKDALVAKERFPRLATYTALWDVNWRNMYYDDFDERTNITLEDFKAEFWQWWFGQQRDRNGVVPPRWVRVRLEPTPTGYYQWPESTVNNNAVKRGLARFHEEVKAAGTEQRDELEESGKKWLEEQWGDGKRNRKWKRKSVT
jgi:hypothetical protein